ncbi:FAD-binding protein [Streptomyces sp. SID10853]|uniref:FAD-binding protein n=1 Tax=Streptomyces sp. SID10853 TaxID=2706028 RepID=UPI0013BFBC73|nr:FAD-binding protein [Streptomyces sp. SID10853]NDZ81606.1 FAD-binding protein [Streptomyces sp. SID10853]
MLRFVVERLPKNLLAYVIRGALTSWIGPNVTMDRAGAILVDGTGRRPANEDTDPAMARAVAAAGNNTGLMVFDEQVARKFAAWPNPVSTFPGVAYAYVQDYKRYRPDVYQRAGTVEELADAIGVDDQLRVVREDGTPVPGLWAAGSTGQGGLQLLNHGLHIGWAMVSGRIVGRNVAGSPRRTDLGVPD